MSDATSQMKWWCFRPLLCTFLRLNWAYVTSQKSCHSFLNWDLMGQLKSEYVIFILEMFNWSTDFAAKSTCSFPLIPTWLGSLFVCWSLTSLCHSNGHIENMPAREINPFTALTRIRSQFLRTQWSTSNHSEWTRLRIRPLSHRGWHMAG